MSRNSLLWILISTMALLVFGCRPAEPPSESSTPPATRETEAPTSTADGAVTGTLMGTSVTLGHAELESQLAIFEGDGWGFSPSLLIFLFLDEGETPYGKTYEITTETGFDSPHVHIRWREGEGDKAEIKAEIFTSEYEMTLVFGQPEGNILPGTIHFKVPDKDTEVEGSFQAKLPVE